MKQFLTGLILTTGYAALANAHTLGAGHAMAARLWHELLVWHHLPFTLLPVVAGLVAYYGYRRATREE